MQSIVLFRDPWLGRVVYSVMGDSENNRLGVEPDERVTVLGYDTSSEWYLVEKKQDVKGLLPQSSVSVGKR